MPERSLKPWWPLCCWGMAALFVALTLVRAVALWAADPLLGYANNYDQIRATVVFGLKPRDSGREIHAATPDQPWRFFVQAAPMRAPYYPSSDLLVKAVQVGAMKVFSGSGGVLDIKVAGATLLIGWLAGVLWVFVRLLARPVAALGFALWCAVLADPVNLLFLNTLYTEFPAFVAATLLVGVLWLWLEKRLTVRWTLTLGAVLVIFLSLGRNQYVFLPLALAPIAIAIWWMARKTSTVTPQRVTGFVAALVIICVIPLAVFQNPFTQSDIVKLVTAANRVDTVMGALLPASKDPRAMLRAMKLPPDCLSLSGKTWYTASMAEFETHCPQIMRLSLARMGRALVTEPGVVSAVVGNIATNSRDFLRDLPNRHGFGARGFLQSFLGQVEGRRFATISGSGDLTAASIDSVIRKLAPDWKERLIWLLVFAPWVLAAGLWAGGARRWALMFAAQGLLFNYCLFSSIFGDGYAELQRHAVLCLSFGALFPILLFTGACTWLHQLFSAPAAPGAFRTSAETAPVFETAPRRSPQR